MKLRKLLAHIESTNFSVKANLASGEESFYRNLGKDTLVDELFKMARPRQAAYEIMLKGLELTREEIDLRYANSYDTPYCVYMWVLQHNHTDLAAILAEEVLRAKNCWWAPKKAQEILDKQTTHAENYELETTQVEALFLKSNICFLPMGLAKSTNTGTVVLSFARNYPISPLSMRFSFVDKFSIHNSVSPPQVTEWSNPAIYDVLAEIQDIQYSEIM